MGIYIFFLKFFNFIFYIDLKYNVYKIFLFIKFKKIIKYIYVNYYNKLKNICFLFFRNLILKKII